MHFMDAVAAEQRDIDAYRDEQEHEAEMEARYVARRPRALEIRESVNLEAWYFASAGFHS